MSIVLEDLVKQYGAHVVVDHLSLEVQEGELLVLLGPSGSGKSTILRLIAGLTNAEHGRIYLQGRDVTELPPQKRNTGFVFQNYSLFRHMNVAANIEFGLSVRGVPRSKRAAKTEELLALVGLGGLGGRLPRQLSGGQQQRVAVARALAFEPSVLLLDEPFGALDVRIREQLRRVLKEVQRKLGVTTILVTHDQEEAFELGDRIGVIHNGRLLEVGPPSALYKSPQQEFVATFLGGANLLAGRHENGRINIGALRLADAAAPTTPDPEGRLEVLLRPEDLLLADRREELTVPVLGQGLVEEVLFLGTLQRVRLRLQPLPGTWHLPMEYGESGLPIQVARIPRREGPLDLKVGQTVWVGIENFHVLPRIPMRLLLCADENMNLLALYQFGSIAARATDGPVTLLGVAEDEGVAQSLVQRSSEMIGGQIPQLACKTRRGRAAEQVLSEIKSGAYDLVILAGESKRQPLVLREENAARVIARHSPIPVLLVKGERPSIRRILFCTAGGEPGKRDVVFGGRLARRAGASTTLLYVESRAGSGREPRQEAPAAPAWVQRHLEEGARTLLNQGIRTEIRVRRGAVIEEILAEAGEGDHDLIVVGGHLAAPSALFPGLDLAEQVIARSDRPVLVVREAPDRT